MKQIKQERGTSNFVIVGQNSVLDQNSVNAKYNIRGKHRSPTKHRKWEDNATNSRKSKGFSEIC